MSITDANSILEQVIEVTAKTLQTDKEKLSLKSNFVDDLGADSLSRVDLVLALEQEFGFEIEIQDANKMHNIGDVVNYVLAVKGDNNEKHNTIAAI